MKAYELLSPPGAWCQGINSLGSPPIAWCIYGAIHQCYPSPLAARKLPDLRQQVCERTGQRLEEWNDDPARTQAEVVALLKELDL